MNKPLLLVGVLVALAAGSTARADDDDCYVPMSKWQTREAVETMAKSQGWNVRRIKIDDGCYEIKGFDASGREIEVKVDPSTLAIVEFEYEDDDDDDDGRKSNRRNNAAPTGSANPPDNGLFVPGSKPKVVLE